MTECTRLTRSRVRAQQIFIDRVNIVALAVIFVVVLVIEVIFEIVQFTRFACHLRCAFDQKSKKCLTG